MRKLYNVSSSPHVRSRLTTGQAMYDVILTLMPATIMGVYHHGFHAFLVILVSIVTGVLTESVFDFITKRPNTVRDGSAILTGLLLALCLPGSVPLYIPFAGSLFAILVVKCLFGGLGHNFMNPALAGRCFLLISFSSVVTNYTYDGVTCATPLADLGAGESVNVIHMLTGMGSGVIGNSTIALFIGGLILWVIGGITFEIPFATLLSFTAFMAVFGGQGFDPMFLLEHLAGGGIIMAAFFMATDPVTSPVTSGGQLLYGCMVGILSGIFRVYGGAADSVSYAVILSNLVVPLIEEVTVPVPYGCRKQKTGGSRKIPKSAISLCVITLIAGAALSGVYGLTKDRITEQQAAASMASYQEVCPDAQSFSTDDSISAVIDALEGTVYGTDFGKVYINEAVVGKDSSGNTVGYVVSVTSGDTYDGTLTVSVGISTDGTISGISFTELHDTAGMGMKCEESEFKDQFIGVAVDKFILNKSQSASAENEINSVSGASISSGATLNAVNAALDFYRENMK